MHLLDVTTEYINDFVGLLFPNHCEACEQPLGKGEDVICLFCQYELPQTDYHRQRENPIEKLFWGRVEVQRAAGLYFFHGKTKVQHLLHKLKYHDKKELPAAEQTKDKNGKTKETTKKNQPFTLMDLKGNKVFLDDFKGKVIYVDFWASWCGPCRQQFPYAKELHHMLSADHLKQVLFLYISLDTDETTWKKAIEKNGIEGFNTLSPGGWSSSAASYFGVTSIPRYVLIDKNGNIADSNAKRPSSGQEIINDIVKLIKQ